MQQSIRIPSLQPTVLRYLIRTSCLSIMILSTLLGQRSVDAQIAWLNVSGGLFETDSNWASGNVPGPLDQIFFGQTGNYEVGFMGNHTIAGIYVTGQANPAFRISPYPSNDRVLTVNGDIILSLGSKLNLDSEGGPGQMIVDNSGYDLSVNGYPYDPDSGHLVLQGGAILTSKRGFLAQSPDSAARLTITGDQSQWELDELITGTSGPVDINIESGGSLTSNQLTEVRNAAIHVIGHGIGGQPSTWASLGEITDIGASSDTEINILAGASATWSPMGTVNLADGTGYAATVLVSGVDATGNPSTLTMGNLSASVYDGHSEITIQQGARMSTMDTLIGDTGSVDVLLSGVDANGNPSQWTAFEFNLKNGTVSIQNGARLEVQDHFTTSPGGTLELFDGVVSSDRIVDNSSDPSDGLNLFAAGVLEFNRFEGDLKWSTGTVAPGIELAPSTVTGDLELESGGKLLMQIGGSAGSSDALSVGGIADLQGSLAVELDNGFTPAATDTFAVLSAASVIGILDNVSSGERLATVDGRGSFVVNYGAASAFDADRIVLSEFASVQFPLGDVNRDGVVNLLDVSPFVDVLTTGSFQFEADINGDGTVNLLDVQPFVALIAG